VLIFVPRRGRRLTILHDLIWRRLLWNLVIDDCRRLRVHHCQAHVFLALKIRNGKFALTDGYLVTMTRPDLAWAYSELSKYVQFPGKNHMLAAEHVLCYLRGTWNRTIRYSRDAHENPNVLWGWVDVDWAGDTYIRRSHTGYILMINGGPISWKSRRQDNVFLSSSKTEFVAASQAGQEAIYLRETLTDFGFSQNKATLLHEDNLACVATSENPVHRKFSRRIDIRKKYVRELVLAGFLKLVPLCTHKTVVDALTKSLPSPAFVGHHQIMTGHASSAARLLGCVGG